MKDILIHFVVKNGSSCTNLFWIEKRSCPHRIKKQCHLKITQYKSKYKSLLEFQTINIS